MVAFLFGALPPASGETWLKVVTPHFTLYSPAKNTEVLRAAAEFQQFIGALGEIVRVDVRNLPPLTIVMFAREKDFRAFRPRKPNGKPWDVAGFFSRQDGWAVFGLPGVELDDTLRRTVFHEGVHWFLSGSEFSNPPWLEEGLAEVFSTFTVSKNRREWGQPIDEHLQVLRSVRPMPLERLLEVSHSDPLFNETQRTGLFYAESWAFVHFLLFGEHNQQRKLFNDYIKEYRTGAHPDEVFRRVFKTDYRGMDHELFNYLDNGKYFVGSQPLEPVTAKLEAEPATALERDIALAQVAVGANRLELADQYIAAARTTGRESAPVSEMTGYCAALRGDEATMLKSFSEAARLGSTDYRVYFDVAQHRHQAASGFGGAAALSAADAREIADGYEQTIRLRPSFLPAYQGLAGIAEHLGSENKEDRVFLRTGRDRYPGDGMIQVGLAAAERLSGANDEARNLLAPILAAPGKYPANVNEYAQGLDESWAFDAASSHIQTLAAAERYEEALAETDALLARGVPQMARVSMKTNRANLWAAVEMTQAQLAWNERRWSDARKLFEAVLSAPTQTGAKYEARRLLAELDRRNLGHD